ncbi:MAG: site-2 protease family protein [Chloroflexota bacterium]
MFRLIFQPGLSTEEIIIRAISVIVIAITAFAYHEYAHAIVADRLGDPTPRNNGRITLNPFPHLDLVGMILLLAVGFGWATTPVRPDLLRGETRKSMALVSVAGPIANILMALLFTIPYQLANFGLIDGIAFTQGNFEFFFRVGLYINVLLFIFNLLPIPPLDGFTILVGILPKPMAQPLMSLRNSGMTAFLFIAIIFILPQFGIDVIGFIFPLVDQVVQFLVS